MNSLEISLTKKRRKSLQINSDNNSLNISKIKNSNIRYSISTNKPNKDIDKTFSKNKNSSFIKKNIDENSIKLLQSLPKRYSYFIPKNNRNKEFNDLEEKKGSFELMRTKTQNILKKNNPKINEDNSLIKGKDKILNHSSNSALNIIENNIKKTLHKMKFEIEEKAKFSKMIEEVSPKIVRNRLTSSPNLEIFFSKKKAKNKHKKRHRASLFIQENFINDKNDIFIKEIKYKRNRSFEYTKQVKNKILKKLRNKIYKSSNEI